MATNFETRYMSAFLVALQIFGSRIFTSVVSHNNEGSVNFRVLVTF